MKGFVLALCQLQVGMNKEENLQRAREMVVQAVQKGAQLVVLPEMFQCPYDGKYFPSFAEEIPGGETTRFLIELARELGIYLCGGSIPEQGTDGIYNTSLLLDPEGKISLKHRKIHLFDIDVPGGITFRESDTLQAGDQLGVLETPLGRLGLMICYDIRFPELVRLLALQGAEMILLPAAFNRITGPPHWELTLRARALDNQVFVVGVSPARNDTASYVAYGHSLVADPWGKVVVEGGEGEELILVTIDGEELEKVRENLPLLQHRREDLYQLSFLGL